MDSDDSEIELVVPSNVKQKQPVSKPIRVEISSDSDESHSDGIHLVSKPARPAKPLARSETVGSSLLTALDQIAHLAPVTSFTNTALPSSSASRSTTSKRTRPVAIDLSEDDSDADLPFIETAPTRQTSKFQPSPPKRPRLSRDTSSETTRTAKQATTEAKKKERQATAEAKKQERAAIAQTKKASLEANKLSSRKETLHEIVVEVSHHLANEDAFFKKLLPQLQDHLQGDGTSQPSSYIVFDPPDAIYDANLIRWRRYTKRYLDAETNHWVVYPDGNLRCYTERTILIFMRATQVAELVEEGDSALVDYMANVRKHYTTANNLTGKLQIFFLVEGLKLYGRPDRNKANQEFQAEARGEVVSKRASRRPNVSYDTICHQLTKLDMLGSCIVQRCEGAVETERLIYELSMDISYRPYKLQSRAYLSNLGIDGTSMDQRSRANDYTSTFIAQLSSIHMITPGVAESIAAKYKTWRNLYEAYESCRDVKERQLMLVGLPKSRNMNGTASAANVGADISKRVYTQLWSRDPNTVLSGKLA